jgi:hypothetical protein
MIIVCVLVFFIDNYCKIIDFTVNLHKLIYICIIKSKNISEEELFVLLVLLIEIFVLSCTIILAILFGKLSWFFSPEGRRYRHQKKFEEIKKRLEERNQLKCNRLSMNSGKKNMHELVAITKKELDYRKSDITPNVLARLESALTRYEVEMKINTVAKIYDLITKNEKVLLNEELKQMINDF